MLFLHYSFAFPLFGFLYIDVLNTTKMFILLRNGLKMMAFSVPAPFLWNHRLFVEKIANAGTLSLHVSVHATCRQVAADNIITILICSLFIKINRKNVPSF
jgi:hypothetical protein